MLGIKTQKPTIVTVSRTLCKNYQSKVAGFTVEVPKGVSVTEVLDLLDFMVEARLSEKYENILKERFRVTYALVFPGEELSSFLKLIDGQTKVKELTTKKNRATGAYNDED